MALLRKIIGERRAAGEQDAATAIVSCCAGLPLALRVAAERVAYRPAPSLASLAAQLADEQRRLDVLTTGGDERASVRSVFSWSYRGLSEGTARVFRLLGVHPGPEVSAPAAAALVGRSVADVVQALDQLTGTHLAEEISPGRYRSHNLLRAYAAELAADADTAADQATATRDVLTWYLHSADAASRQIGGERRRVPLDPAGHVRPLTFTGYDDALAWCDAEQNNLIAAAQRAAEAGFTDIAWKIPAAASDFFRVRRPWSDWIACNQAGLAAARQSGDAQGQAWSLNDLGSAYHELARYAEAAQCYEEALRLVRQTGDRHDEGAVLNNLGEVYLELPRTDAAIQSFRQSLDVARQAGNRLVEATALDNLGEAYRRTGRARLAIGWHRKALDITVQIGNRQGEAQVLHNLGQAHRLLGQPERARECYLHALEAYSQVGDRHGEAGTHARLGDLLQSTGSARDAREHWHRAFTIFDRVGDPRANQVRALLQT
jgi:tetratricopeptide (TPR) repeat protein